MRLILTILFLYALTASATTYYVSNSGSNNNAGTLAAPFWTAAKAMSVAVSGDSIRFNKGDFWNEKISIPVSNLYIGAYGTGAKPLITGFQTLTGFTNVGNIWSATATNGVTGLNTALYNGKIVAKGRYPNTTNLTWSTYSDSSITGGLSTNYTGGEIVVRTNHFILDNSKITSQTGGTINFSPKLTYNPSAYNAYFIQNIESVLDLDGEWSWNDATKVFKIYSATTPDVKVSVIDTLINCTGKSYITFDGLNITGANKAAILFDSTHHITITNCTIENNGKNGLQGYPAKYITVSNDSILNSLNIGARIFGPYLTFTGNYVNRTGFFPGMGQSGNGTYMGIYCGDTSQTITYNRFDSTGYVPINWQQGINSNVSYNYVNYYAFNKDDGGGIYNYLGGAGSTISYNIITNGKGAGYLFGYGTEIAPGIYLDNGLEAGTQNVSVIGNTTINTAFAGLYLHGNRFITVTDNTFIDSVGYPIRIEQNYYNNQLDHTIKRNVFYSQSPSYEAFWSESSAHLTPDSNYYIRPTAEANKFKAAGTSYSQAGWSAFDTHAFTVPANITTDLPLVYYNPSASALTNLLSGTYLNAQGAGYENSVQLPPFGSVLLFKSLYSVFQSTQQFKKIKFRKIIAR